MVKGSNHNSSRKDRLISIRQWYRTQNDLKEMNRMSTNSSNRLVNPAAREAMDKFKMEAASQVGVNLKNGYNGELTSRQAGSIGGQMVRKMIEAYENGMK